MSESKTCSCPEPGPDWRVISAATGYESCATERGWCCYLCDKPMPGDPPGYSPRLDREEILVKVDCLMLALQEAGFCHFSNSSDGEGCCAMVADKCVKTKRYDSKSICQFIFKDRADGGKYWRDIGEGIMVGNDPRSRCQALGCKKLAKCHIGTMGFCMEHRNEELLQLIEKRD